MIYQVKLEPGLKDGDGLLDGRHRPSDCSLTIRAELPDSDYRKAVLLHEVIHACMETSAVRLPQELVEPVSDALAYTFLALLRDNPKLVEYLTCR